MTARNNKWLYQKKSADGKFGYLIPDDAKKEIQQIISANPENNISKLKNYLMKTYNIGEYTSLRWIIKVENEMARK